MARLQDLSVQRKLMVIIMSTTVLALLLASGAFFAYDRHTYRDKMVRDLGALAETLKANTTNALVFNDAEAAGQILSGLQVQPRIVSARIFDREGELFASYARGSSTLPPLATMPRADGHDFAAERLALYRQIRFGNQQVGVFYIESDLGELSERVADYLQILVLVILGVSLLAFFFSSVLQKVVSKPILALAQVARRVSEKKDFSLRAVPHGKDEIGRLIDGFNGMLAQIQIRDEELIVAKEKAEQANRSKSIFLANMSHELRTPLTAIIGYSEILEDDARDMGLEDFLPDLQKIQAAGKHLLGLINSILDLSKVESGKMELFVESFELSTLVNEVASTITPLIEKNQNTLSIQAADDLGTVKADLTKTRQILLNLLSNASKFTDKGRVTLEVRRQRQGPEEMFVFVVRDSGIGMSPDQLSRLFKPFSQADASTSRKYGGTGLGLALCKRFAQVMGGRIDVASELGKGTTFTVSLPTAMSPGKKSAPALHHSGEWGKRPDSGEWGKRPRPLTEAGARLVLVVDDDPAVHELLRDLLEKEGYRVATASSGQEGLKLARELAPAIITLDIYMPDGDGWSVLSALKADPQLEPIPVIMISISDERQKGYAMGADYLAKPIDRRALTQLLAKYSSKNGPQEVLVVDDDPNIRGVVRRLLEEQGYTVSEAENGVEGLRRIAAAPPSLIFLDLMMPQMDGFAFMTQLRKDADLRQIPVIVLTAMDLGPDEISRLNGGVEKILQKGAYSLDELKSEIRSLARDSLRA